MMISPLFVCHGGPTLAIDNNEYTRFLKDLGRKVKPKAIVIFTAHWESEVTRVSAISGTYNMIYDFYGFPLELYSIKYRAKGSVEIASKIQKLFQDKKIQNELDTKRGLDHGSWIMLHLMYPEANIPIIQVSVNPSLTMKEQYTIGDALKSLAEEDILILGSGATVHNLASIKWEAASPEAWAVEFDDWLAMRAENKAIEELFSYRELAPYAERAIPREEHIVPFFIAMGSGHSTKPTLLHRSYEYGTLSYMCFEF